MVPSTDADGEINPVGKRVEYLTAVMQDGTQELFEKYAELMKLAGYRGNNSGLYIG